MFAIVRPDTYTLQAALQGFKTLERTNVVVNANDRITTGTLTLEVGQMTEEVSVTSRVTEVQSTSGERSFALESEALTNIAASSRQLFNLMSLVPGAVQNGTGGTEIGAADGFTVNGQRPNSNNVTIDGVANIDTGNNGGNMVTTNLDAVAEFKVLTNAYQAEYGRAVGGQLQVVTKSGGQQFHGSGYWYGRRSEWNANTWTQQTRDAGDPAGQDVAQRLRLHDRRADLHARLQRRQETAVLLLEPGVAAAHEPGGRAAGTRANGPRAGG